MIASTTRREDARQDRLVRAQIERDAEAARIQARIAEREAGVRIRFEEQAARRVARAAAREARAARLGAFAGWVDEHVTDLLFVPVIGVPALLSWTAMSEFGSRLYGFPGYLLPAFSEGAMWAFAAAVTITLRRYPSRQVWHLRAGIAVFALFGAALNFLHGMSVPYSLFPDGASGPMTGGIMAAISVAGVLAHQLITAGPGDRRVKREHAAEPEAAVAPVRVTLPPQAGHRSTLAIVSRHAPVPAEVPVPEHVAHTVPQPDGRRVLQIVAAPEVTGDVPGVVLPDIPDYLAVPRSMPAPVPAPVTTFLAPPEPEHANVPAEHERVHTGDTAWFTLAPEPPADGHASTDVEHEYAEELRTGVLPTIRDIKRRSHVGNPKAQQIQLQLEALIGERANAA